MPLPRLAILGLLLGHLPLAASPELAARIQLDWEKAAKDWTRLAQEAVSPEQRAAVVAARPDAAEYAVRMWKCIAPALDQPWSLRPAAWFLQISHGIKGAEPATPRFAPQIEAVKKAVLAHHTRSKDPGIHIMCLALSRLGDPFSLSILEKIESENPDPEIQGVAALTASMVIKGLGDDADLMRRRLTYLRKAIINSADVELGSTTVAKLAENELYQIRYLSKGRVAPDIRGFDSSGTPVQLSDQVGKIVILVFWSSTIPEADHVIEFTNEMAAKFKGRPVMILGINHDSPEKLRAMRTDGSVTWRNLSDPKNLLARDYRVGVWPMVYVLDSQRRIQYSGPLGSFAELTADALAAEIR